MSSTNPQRLKECPPGLTTIDHLRDKNPLHITTCPPEIIYLLFELLGPVYSTCLGLTCKKLYSIHRSFYGTVSLATSTVSPDSRSVYLHQVLESWICQGLPLRKQILLVYNPLVDKFQDFAHIRLKFDTDEKEARQRVLELSIEKENLDKRIETEFSGVPALNSPLRPEFNRLTTLCEEAWKKELLARGDRKFLHVSFTYPVLHVEEKAAQHGFMVDSVVWAKLRMFQGTEG